MAGARTVRHDDLAELHAAAVQVPGAEPSTPKVVVSRTGTAVRDIDLVLSPGDLVAAWRPATAHGSS